MRITGEQARILDGYTCERLTSKEDNRDLIKSFVNQRGYLLVNYLQEYGWEEDKAGKTAFYLIKNPEGTPCIFFALKCGALFQPLNEDELRKAIEEARQFLQLPQGTYIEWTEDYIKRRLEYKRTKRDSEEILWYLENDRQREGKRPILRVDKTFSGVEITHFCINENTKKLWRSHGFPMGQVLFWKYIAPILVNIQKVVRCQYAFLFSADETLDGTLTNYYNVALKFSKQEDIGTSKPFYDFGCEFMSQEICNIKKNMDDFFAHFNLDKADEIV